MIDGGTRQTAFGRRRSADRIEDPGPRTAFDVEPSPAPPRVVLPWALRMAALLGLGALIAIRLLAHTGSPYEAAGTRVARSLPAGPVDPETTGSIGGSATTVATDRQALPVPSRCTALVACLQAPRGRPGP